MAIRKDVVVTPSRVVDECSSEQPFGPPPLIEGEDRAAYDGYLAKISAAVEPKDFIEELLVQDIVELAWEIRRMRRLTASLLSLHLSKGLRQVLMIVMEETEAVNLAHLWAEGDQTAIDQVNEIFASTGLTMEMVRSRTLSDNLDAVERFDRMTMNAEARRNAALHEIERHRSCFAEALRGATDDVVDGEFEAVAGNGPGEEMAPDDVDAAPHEYPRENEYDRPVWNDQRPQASRQSRK
jgi:hypothetical protein